MEILAYFIYSQQIIRNTYVSYSVFFAVVTVQPVCRIPEHVARDVPQILVNMEVVAEPHEWGMYVLYMLWET